MTYLNEQLIILLNRTVTHEGVFTDLVHWVADKLDIWIIALLLLWFLYRAWQRQKASHRLFCFSCFHEVVMVILTGGLAWGAAGLLKILVATARPFAVEALNIVPLFIPNDPWGFPSGHTALFLALGLVTWFHDRVVGTIVIVLAVCIALTRIMAGVHFPLDILGGALVAGIVVSVLMLFDVHHIRKQA